MNKESKELTDNKPSNFVIFSHLDQSTKPLYGHIEYPIFERDDKTGHSSDIIRISIDVNLYSENFPSSLYVTVWENWKGLVGRVHHKWDVKEGKGRFTRLGFSDNAKEHTRKICEEVFFNQDITELHFPEGIVRLK